MPNPIVRVLSTLRRHEVSCLLMGGQACVYYGAAEFSRDTDVALLASADNVARLEGAMKELQAEVIAVPPLQLRHLERGHAVHFRCRHPEADGMRLDVLSVMRGLPGFSILWGRRTTALLDGEVVELMSLADLVVAKKTQRDKDWPMIRRLVEANYVQFRDQPNAERVRFWLAEARTPALLREAARRFADSLETHLHARPFLRRLDVMTDDEIATELAAEECRERRADATYWRPLRLELERMRHDRVPQCGHP